MTDTQTQSNLFTLRNLEDFFLKKWIKWACNIEEKFWLCVYVCVFANMVNVELFKQKLEFQIICPYLHELN